MNRYLDRIEKSASAASALKNLGQAAKDYSGMTARSLKSQQNALRSEAAGMDRRARSINRNIGQASAGTATRGTRARADERKLALIDGARSREAQADAMGPAVASAQAKAKTGRRHAIQGGVTGGVVGAVGTGVSKLSTGNEKSASAASALKNLGQAAKDYSGMTARSLRSQQDALRSEADGMWRRGRNIARNIGQSGAGTATRATQERADDVTLSLARGSRVRREQADAMGPALASAQAKAKTGRRYGAAAGTVGVAGAGAGAASKLKTRDKDNS